MIKNKKKLKKDKISGPQKVRQSRYWMHDLQAFIYFHPFQCLLFMRSRCHGRGSCQ